MVLLFLYLGIQSFPFDEKREFKGRRADAQERSRHSQKNWCLHFRKVEVWQQGGISFATTFHNVWFFATKKENSEKKLTGNTPLWDYLHIHAYWKMTYHLIPSLKTCFVKCLILTVQIVKIEHCYPGWPLKYAFLHTLKFSCLFLNSFWSENLSSALLNECSILTSHTYLQGRHSNQCHHALALVNFLVSKVSKVSFFTIPWSKSLEVALVNFHLVWRPCK